MKPALRTYYAKRDFEGTPEPEDRESSKRLQHPIFVIQKHDARRLHYDFRLESNGVLKSWAVPKGPSTHPGEKRLAVQTEDHPMSYANFEGTIPKGNYGAGQVILWDHGIYENQTYQNGRLIPMEKAMQKGHVVVVPKGKKIRGAYSLTRFRQEGSKAQWLLVKVRDAEADRSDPVTEHPESVVSGRVLTRDREHVLLRTAPRKPMPVWLEPMRATLTEDRFSGPNWIFEPKLDGVRCLAFGQKGRIKLLSRNQLAMNATYPEIVEALKKQPLDSFILDGEIVAFRPQTSITSFEVLQQRIGIHDVAEARRHPTRVYFYVFDLLYLNGRDLRDFPLEQRKDTLQAVCRFDSAVRYTSHVMDRGEAYYAEACRQGWEGLIAKRRDSRYRSQRTGDWLKFKCIQEQEFVIGGYSNPEGAREHFGALLLGYYDHGVLRYAGKVGTGFNSQSLRLLMTGLKKIEQKESPFASIDIPQRGLHWVKPALIAQIGFSEWTRDGKLRQPRFIGLRTDKKPHDVSREKPVSTGAAHAKKKSSSQSR